MPRPVDESKLRRFMMQGTMWVILGATVGLAALVNQTKQHSLKIVLDEPREFEGFSLQLPRGWKEVETNADNGGAVAVEDPLMGDVLIVSSLPRFNLVNNYSRRGYGGGIPAGTISIAGRTSSITLTTVAGNEDEPPLSRLRVTRELDSGRNLTISLLSPTVVQRGDLGPLEYEINVIKHVAESVQLDSAPTTEP